MKEKERKQERKIVILHYQEIIWPLLCCVIVLPCLLKVVWTQCFGLGLIIKLELIFLLKACNCSVKWVKQCSSVPRAGGGQDAGQRAGERESGRAVLAHIRDSVCEEQHTSNFPDWTPTAVYTLWWVSKCSVILVEIEISFYLINLLRHFALLTK